MNDWIQTLTGKVCRPQALTPEMVGPIEEIAHALAGRYRFSGQTQERYSVAEHCVRGAQLMPRAFAGAFLLHELSEVYLPDIPSPLKQFVRVHTPDGQIPWSALEGDHTAMILASLGLSSIEPLIYSPEVKEMDLAMLAWEKRDLVITEAEPWNLTVPPPKAAEHVKLVSAWAPQKAASEFLITFKFMFGGQ